MDFLSLRTFAYWLTYYYLKSMREGCFTDGKGGNYFIFFWTENDFLFDSGEDCFGVFEINAFEVCAGAEWSEAESEGVEKGGVFKIYFYISHIL